jgi:hypothetical protein
MDIDEYDLISPKHIMCTSNKSWISQVSYHVYKLENFICSHFLVFLLQKIKKCYFDVNCEFNWMMSLISLIAQMFVLFSMQLKFGLSIRGVNVYNNYRM